MTKKQPGNDPFQIGRDAIGDFKPHIRLNIKEIRRRTEELRGCLARGQLPDWSDMPHWQRFAVVLRLLPIEQRALLLGKSDKQLQRYEAGVEMPFPVVAALAVETEIPLDWIATGRPPGVGPTTIFSDDEVLVQKLTWRASAGHGSLILDERADGIYFPRVILERIGVKPENARIWEASGESMVPTVGDGDMIVVDISSTQIAEGKVYAFSIGEEVFVKRLRRLGEKVLMMSDNRELFPTDEPVPADQSFVIFGRVKWAGRAL
jgi:hypothetical protein